MVPDITLGQYYPAASPIHRLDPRMKLLLTVLYMVLLFQVRNYYGFGLVFLFSILITVISRVPARFLLKGIKPILFIAVFTGVINIFYTNGTVIYKLGFLEITWEGLDTAAKLILRLLFLITGASFLTLTTTPIDLTDGLERALSPLKKLGIPAHEIAMMMTIALRFIPTLLEETDKIMKAQASRGADFETGSLMQKAKSLVPVLVPLFINAFRRADELAVAMEARCYRGGEGRTKMKQLNYTWLDGIALTVMFLFGVGIFILNRL